MNKVLKICIRKFKMIKIYHFKEPKDSLNFIDNLQEESKYKMNKIN